MPLPISLAHKITARLAEVAQERACCRYLRPDGKAQVTVRYDEQDGRLVPIASTACWSRPSTHPDVPTSSTQIRRDIVEHVLRPVIPATSARPSGSASLASCSSTRPAGSSPAARWATPG